MGYSPFHFMKETINDNNPGTSIHTAWYYERFTKT